ncbi:MAG: TIGR00266 family protein [Vulcanimicrobiota bacterium]
METELAGNPDFGHIKFRLDSGDKILVESGAMAVMDTHVAVESKMMGGFVPAVMRKLLAGESLMVGEYSSSQAGQRLQISPAIPGQVLHRNLQGETLMMQAGSFLACTPGVNVSTVFGGIKALFSGEGMFFLKITGQGDLWFNAYGSVVEHEMSGDFIVDTGHVVGWEPSVNWEITGMGNLMSTIFSGEGLVIRFSGSGKVWLQTRSMGGLSGWLSGYCRG